MIKGLSGVYGKNQIGIFMDNIEQIDGYKIKTLEFLVTKQNRWFNIKFGSINK